MTHEHKIKQSDVATLRSAKLSDQNGKCGICGHTVRKRDAALDHCHRSGRVRGVVHKDCNILLGKVENFTSRYGRRMITEGRLADFLDNCSWYMHRDYEHNPLHWKHKTDEDKLRLKYKRLLRRSKRAETKAKYRRLLEEL